MLRSISELPSLRFALRHAGFARVSLFDVNGRRVRTLAEGMFAAGPHETAWDTRDAGGQPVPAGVYFVRVEAGGGAETHRAVLMR